MRADDTAALRWKQAEAATAAFFLDRTRGDAPTLDGPLAYTSSQGVEVRATPAHP